MKPRHHDFFKYARARHEIYLRRAAGLPREEWTGDPIFQENRFTNVFRELDKTTVWFRKNVRGPLASKPEVLLATVLFRMFNRIEVGEAIFCQGVAGPFTAVPELLEERRGTRRAARTPFEVFCADGDIKQLRAYIRQSLPRGPYSTGAYIISSPPGYSKLDGILRIMRDFNEKECLKPHCGMADWRCGARWLLENAAEGQSLRNCWTWLREFPYLGVFHSYEIVTDLRHTALLSRASDVDTWANVGPGARRGLNRIHGRRKPDSEGTRKGWGLKIPEEQALEEMRQILSLSRDAVYWPQGHKRTASGAKIAEQWPRWEMRDVEHTLCEFDKYERVRTGEGKPRGRFK